MGMDMDMGKGLSKKEIVDNIEDYDAEQITKITTVLMRNMTTSRLGGIQMQSVPG